MESALTEDLATTNVNPTVADAAPHLTFAVDPGKPDERLIACRRVVTLLGRRQGCKVVMQHRRLSPVHVAIVNDGTQLIAVDLVTPSGTLLNGLKMEHERLSDGDMLTCPPWEMRVDIEVPEHSGNADAHPFGLDPSPHAVALEHMETGRLLQPGRDVCIIGRLNGCDINISDTDVSRVHALLFSYYGQPAVFDLLSRNQTCVNDQQVQFRMLRNEDVLKIGKTQFKVRLADSPIVERANGLKPAAETTVELKAEASEADMIDIHATESSQRWRIAEKLERSSRKK